MALGIASNGIVQRDQQGITTILRPGKNGGTSTEIAVNAVLADAYQLATGDIVEGTIDEGQLTTIDRVNGLGEEAAKERPFARSRRSQSERSSPDRSITIASGEDDLTGQMLDIAAPLGLGYFGIIWGQHGNGLTRTLRTVLDGIVNDAPDALPFVLLLRARSEEMTDWRRRFPGAEIVCASPFDNTAGEILRLADLLLEAAQRQTELGKDVIILIDTLTGLWAAMLEAEEADDQAQADQSSARQRMREWVQRAGCFHNQPPLGGGLGGSLTIIGTVWHQAIDRDEEEERETHPHLRLLDYLIPEASWQVMMSDVLAQARLFPAIDVRKCLSRDEERFLLPESYDTLVEMRSSLPRRDPVECYHQLMAILRR